jgi:hypothetical protein
MKSSESPKENSPRFIIKRNRHVHWHPIHEDDKFDKAAFRYFETALERSSAVMLCSDELCIGKYVFNYSHPRLTQQERAKFGGLDT